MTGRITGRLVTTGHVGEHAVFVSDTTRSEAQLAGQAVRSLFLWGRDDIAKFPDDGEMPALVSDQPLPGGCRIATLTIEPGANDAYNNFIVAALGDRAERDAPGFHRTPTFDFVLVLGGELTLELDLGSERQLRAGDCAVLNGVRHRWRNSGDTAATILAVQIGADDNRECAAPELTSR